MPIYEYECPKCEKVFEVQQSIKDDPKSTCDDCGGPVARILSRSSFHLKGGGWYKDLYSSTGAKNGASGGTEVSTSSGPTEPASSGTGQGDAKPASSASKSGGSASD